MATKLTQEEFLKRIKNIHGNTYDYTNTIYTKSADKVEIICKTHGSFWQKANDHMRGRGCAKCAGNVKDDTNTFIKKARHLHGDLYKYDKVEYEGSHNKVTIECKIHGDFEQTPALHLTGRGCQACAGNKRHTTEEFIKKAKRIHGDVYDYTTTVYGINNNDDVEIKCKIHGIFTQTPKAHLRGHGCQQCGTIKKDTERFITEAVDIHNNAYGYERVEYKHSEEEVIIICKVHGEFRQKPSIHLKGHGCKKCASNAVLTTTEFVQQAIAIHGDKYNYDNTIYSKSSDKVAIWCNTHGNFMQKANDHTQGHGCPMCGNTGPSMGEQELSDFLQNHTEVMISNREILNGLEIDILLPEEQLGIEYNGLYWHSDIYKDKQYHLDKTELAINKGYQLIHIFEDEWLFKKDIVKSRLLNIIGKTPNRIYARKTEIKEVRTRDAMEFLDKNHIQGRLGGMVKIGLYYNEELVSLMTFGKLRANLGQSNKDGHYELLRFCNKINTTVVGGATKLYKHFEKNYKPLKIISYADRRWSEGNLYKQLGFDLEYCTVPNYFYVKGLQRENRYKYRKSELVKAGHNLNKTERQIMRELGYNRIYDCGTLKFIKNYE